MQIERRQSVAPRNDLDQAGQSGIASFYCTPNMASATRFNSAATIEYVPEIAERVGKATSQLRLPVKRRLGCGGL